MCEFSNLKYYNYVEWQNFFCRNGFPRCLVLVLWSWGATAVFGVVWVEIQMMGFIQFQGIWRELVFAASSNRIAEGTSSE
jgi:hypothetical protein